MPRPEYRRMTSWRWSVLWTPPAHDRVDMLALDFPVGAKDGCYRTFLSDEEYKKALEHQRFGNTKTRRHAAVIESLLFMTTRNGRGRVKESLIDSVIHADDIFLRPAASQKPRNSAAIPSVSFLAGRKNLLVIAKTS